MKTSEIKKIPSIIGTVPEGLRIHESNLIAHHILEKVKEYLSMEIPSSVILEMIEDIQDSMESSKEIGRLA